MGSKAVVRIRYPPLAVIHGIHRHNISPGDAVVARLKHTHVGQRHKAIAAEFVGRGRPVSRSLHGAVAPLPLCHITGCDVTLLTVVEQRHGQRGDITNVAVWAADIERAVYLYPAALNDRYNGLRGRYALHGMTRVYPTAASTIAVGDVHLERQTAATGFLGCKLQMVPPRLTESILCPIGRCVLSMVLVIVNHASESCIAQRLGIGGNALVGGLLIAEEPPCLHSVVWSRRLPQLSHSLEPTILLSTH